MPMATMARFEPGSLLAGPRNVQPYIVKRGEQYMSKQQLEHFRFILNSWKRDLMVEVDRTVTHMKDEAANFPDPNDRATQEEEFSSSLRTRDRERKLIRKIDDALKRIEDGSYGYCLETGEENRHQAPGSTPRRHPQHRSPGAPRTARAPVRRPRRPLSLALASLSARPSAASPGYVGRFAPSPTGSLHLGSLSPRWAASSMPAAAAAAGFLRMEDLDAARVIPGCADEMLHTLEGFGLHWTAPSSTRRPHRTLRARANRLLTAPGLTFQCSSPPRAHPEGGYPGTCRDGPRPPRPTATRFRVEDARRAFEDRRRGSAASRWHAGTSHPAPGARSPTSWRWW